MAPLYILGTHAKNDGVLGPAWLVSPTGPAQPGAAIPIPAEAATVALLERSTLEPSAAHRADAIDQAPDLTPGKVHRTRPAATLTAYWLEQTGGDPGADPTGGQAETLDYLRNGYQHIVCHTCTLYEVQSIVKPFLLLNVA